MSVAPPARRLPHATFSVHPHTLGARQCDRVVELGLSARRQDGRLAGGVEGIDDTGLLRSSTVAWIPRDGDSEWLFAKLEDVARRANRHWGLELSGLEEDLQFTEYAEPGAHYTWHHDGLDPGVEHRKLSLVVQLSDPRDHRGADLEFIEVVEDYDEEMRREYRASVSPRGTVVAFPAWEYHRVTPLRWGRRRSLVAWLSGPPLR